MLAQKLALSYVSRILLQFIQIAVTIVVARIAGPTVLGTIAFGLAFVNMFAFIADLGIPTAYIKSINDGDNEARANGTFLRLQFALTGVFFIVVLSWLLIQKYGFHYKFESKTHEYVIIVFLFAITIQRLFQGIKTLFIARTQQAKQDIPDLIQALIYQGIRLVVVILGYKALAIAFSNLAATIIIIPFYFYLLKPYTIGNFDKQLAIKYFKISVPLIIILIAQTVLGQSDKVLLQYFTNSETLGYYTAGFRIGGFIRLIASAVGLLFFPIFTKAISENKVQIINLKIKQFERFMWAFVFPVVATVAIYSGVIVHLILGEKYAPTIPILSIITISMFFLTFFQPYGNIIVAKGKFYQASVIYIVQLMVFLLMAFLLVSPDILNLGAVGMAWLILFSNILLGGLFVFYAKKDVEEINLLPGLRLAVYGLVFGLVSYFIYYYLNMGLLYKALFLIIYFILFYTIGYVFKLIKVEDFNMIMEVINVKKMRKYIGSEVFSNKK